MDISEQLNLLGVSFNSRTLEEQADLFEISISSLHKWASEGYPLKGSLKDQIRWVRENRPLASDKSLSEARREKIEVEIELRRLELLIKRGELIPRSEVSALFTDRLMIVRNGLLNLHRVVQAKLMGRDPHEVGSIIRQEAISVLERYSRRSGHLLLKGEDK
jgi:hypothetical protein